MTIQIKKIQPASNALSFFTLYGSWYLENINKSSQILVTHSEPVFSIHELESENKSPGSAQKGKKASAFGDNPSNNIKLPV